MSGTNRRSPTWCPPLDFHDFGTDEIRVFLPIPSKAPHSLPIRKALAQTINSPRYIGTGSPQFDWSSPPSPDSPPLSCFFLIDVGLSPVAHLCSVATRTSVADSAVLFLQSLIYGIRNCSLSSEGVCGCWGCRGFWVAEVRRMLLNKTGRYERCWTSRSGGL